MKPMFSIMNLTYLEEGVHITLEVERYSIGVIINIIAMC
jgi:hypothetical protein